MIGTRALHEEVERAGAVVVGRDPDFVLVGSGGRYNAQLLEKATKAVRDGAKLLGTNPETSGLTEHSIKPGTGALIAPIQLATNTKPFFVGKPNHLMLHAALKKLHLRHDNAYAIGDRMDTDVLVGLETGLKTILILQGEITRAGLKRFSYQPDYVFDRADQIPPDKPAQF